MIGGRDRSIPSSQETASYFLLLLLLYVVSHCQLLLLFPIQQVLPIGDACLL